MNRKSTLFSLLLCIILVIPSLSFGQYVVGNSVPNFTLNDVDGTQFSLYNYTGELVLLNFYATW